MSENVLCIPTASLPADWRQAMCAMPLTGPEFYQAVSDRQAAWLPRKKAETDPNFKQIIPYIILQTCDRQHIGCYCRKGSETRLHDLWSVGIGGHINTGDRPDDYSDDGACDSPSLETVIANGLRRELAEEVPVMPDNATPVFMGIINEEQTEVGAVHLGMVYCLTIEDMNAVCPGDELNRFQWIRMDQVSDYHMELWSELALKVIA